MGHRSLVESENTLDQFYNRQTSCECIVKVYECIHIECVHHVVRSYGRGRGPEDETNEMLVVTNFYLLPFDCVNLRGTPI